MQYEISTPSIREYYAKNEFTSLKLCELEPFKDHPFKLYKGERLDDLIASIKKSGLINPIIVRTTGENKYEIISGHNRVQAFKALEKKEIPAIILKDLPNDKAFAYVIESNVLQRSFSEMSHSEKAAVLSAHHSELFSQGKRNDIQAEIERLNSIEKGKIKESDTFYQSDKGFRSNEVVGEMYSLSPAQVSRYLRIHVLNKQLKELLDAGKIGFTTAVELSFLPKKAQDYVADYAMCKHLSIDGRKAKTLRAFDLVGELDENKIIRILSGTLIPKPPRKPSNPVTISPAIYEKYFSSNKSHKEIEKTIEAALKAYFNK
jgi:ParB family chromosome partitioning protein